MDPDRPEEATGQPASSWTTRIRSNADPEETIRDCVLFMAFTHLFAIVYFILKGGKDKHSDGEGCNVHNNSARGNVRSQSRDNGSRYNLRNGGWARDNATDIHTKVKVKEELKKKRTFLQGSEHIDIRIAR